MVASAPRIDGIYELGHVLHVLDAASHGFARIDIERVECFWTFGDMHSSAAAFVLRLRDGRRALVDFVHWHAFEQDEDFRIDVQFLPVETGVPNTGEAVNWSFDTMHLDRRLAT
jgi:hypothetical protein